MISAAQHSVGDVAKQRCLYGAGGGDSRGSGKVGSCALPLSGGAVAALTEILLQYAEAVGALL
jgi:hypothetical protein